jgi:hypothetical protein
MPQSRAKLSESPRLTTGKDAEPRRGAVGLAKPPAGWNSWNPVGSAPRRRFPSGPHTKRTRSALGTAHVCELHEYPVSDDFAGCWA